jgi:2-hydroxy-6-oxonona-2,4-dienedioate hydrolase
MTGPATVADTELPHPIRQALVPTAAGPVRYVYAGSGDPLFLIHGGFGGWEHWYANIVPLSQRYTVIAPDMPGFGLSCDIDREAPIETYAAAVWESITAIRGRLPAHLQARPIRMAGFSFGTAVCATLALRYPEQVHSILLVNPPGLGTVPDELKEMQARANTAARREGLRAGLEISLHEFMLCQPERANAFAGDLMERCTRRSRFVSRSLSRSTPIVHRLHEFPVPVHIVLGAHDLHQRSQLQERTTKVLTALGQEGLTVFPDASHWLQYDQPERFNALALDWFEATPMAPDLTQPASATSSGRR